MFRNRLYLAAVSGHFAVDMLNSIGAVLLAILVVPFGLTNAQIGAALTMYMLVGSLSQPPAGWLSDRFQLDGRSVALAGAGVAWMALCFSIVAFAQSWVIILPFFLLAALGSGVFHPIGTALAPVAHPERATSATAVFFFCGQMGLALGPMLGGVLFSNAGVLGVLPLSALALGPVALAFWAARSLPLARGAATPTVAQLRRETPRISWSTITLLVIAAFVLLTALRSASQMIYQSFLPKLFADRGWDPTLYGALAGTFMAAAAVGNVAFGYIADRFGMRAATVLPMLLSVPAGLTCLLAPSTTVAFAASALTGGMIGGQHSVLVMHAQRLLPTGQGLAAGVFLSFTFASGAAGAWATGLAADRYGLLLVMQAAAWLGVPSALLALTLPGRKRPVGAEAIERAGSVFEGDSSVQS